MTHAPLDGQRQASYKEALEGRDKKTVTAPQFCDRNGVPLLKAASTAVIISCLLQIQIIWKMVNVKT